ncbi:MAG: NYN domain-containing protein [Endozoicomonas sp.]|uniref:NYN domain-containing protein n=1 Tax=Endozoicomonas sp. TaxID=1892382 RepID=UPI003D9BA1AB
MSRSKIAVFVDVENLTKWLKNKGPEQLVTELSSTGQLIVRKAYGNWNNAGIQCFQQDLNRQGFELVHNFHPVSGKNSSDIQMTVDVMESAIRLTDVDWFVLATGDSDFSPLFRRLREMGKEVIGVGPRSSLSESVKTSCSRYIFTDSPDVEDLSKEQEKAIQLTLNTLKTFDGAAHCSSLKNRLIALDSAFDEKALGFNSFTEFLNSIEGLDIFQEGKIWQARRKKSKSHSSTTKKQSNKSSSVDIAHSVYHEALEQYDFPSTPSTALTKACKYVLGRGPACRSALPTIIVEGNKGQISLDEAKDIVKILFKSQLYQTAGKNSKGEPLFTLKPDLSHLREIDISIISRVMTYCRKRGEKIQDKHLRPLLYGEYNKADIITIKTAAEARIPDS